MTENQIKDLRDLWEGCFDFDTAVAMINLDELAIGRDASETAIAEASKHWNRWNRKFEASQRA